MFDEFVKEIMRQMFAMGKLFADQMMGDWDLIFLNERLFKLPKNEQVPADPNFILSEDNLTMFEINERLGNLETSHLVQIKTDKGKKRTFVISKQKIFFDEEECDMLVIEEQTSFYQLDKKKKQTMGIKLANAIVFSKSQESLETINQYVEILLRKVA